MGRITEYIHLLNNPGKTEEWIKTHIFWCPIEWRERKYIAPVKNEQKKKVPKDIFGD